MQLPLPRTKKELREFLGLTEYCRLQIEAYAQKTKILYLKLLEEKPNTLNWTEEEKEIVEKLKQDLITAPVIAFPALNKSFHLFITVNEGAVLRVLTQEWGDRRKTVAYLSKLLDLVSQGWPVCSGSSSNCLTGRRKQEIDLLGAIHCCYPSPSEDYPYSERRKMAD